jgi:hypothetical protein
MELNRVFGKGFLEDLNEAVLTVGKDQYSKRTLASEVGVTNLVAARKLSAFCNALRIKSVKQLYEETTPYTFAGAEGVGLTTMYVAWMLFQHNELDPAQWYTKGQDGAVVTFLAYKHREQQALKKTERAAQKRHRTRARIVKADSNQKGAHHGLR